MLIRPGKRLRGSVTLPGDKSISHRAAMIAAMADGATRIENYSASEDCSSTLECLDRLGVDIERDNATVRIAGVGKSGFRAAGQPLDCGNSGTTMRLLSGILAGQDFESVVNGDESLCRRPMKRIIEPLSAMGARIDSHDGRAPLNIRGQNPLSAIDYELPVASAQIKSCVLLAGLNADGRTSVIEPVPTRDHTERMLRWFGVDVDEVSVRDARKLSLAGDSRPRSPGELRVPADISAAAFFIVAAACLPSSDLRLENVGINPTRSAIIEVMLSLGATPSVSDTRDVNNEPIGTVTVRGGLGLQQTTEIRGSVIANLIDEIPVLAVLGTQLEFGLEVRDAGELRVKESDRISAVVENLKLMGAGIEEFEDGFRVARSGLRGAKVNSYGDHRIAMAFAVAGLLADGETEIEDAECAAVSFPGFFEVLDSVVDR